jgi:DNA-binding SARP family transcriptional activator/tetratricopeptide (TPR) repeat protein
MKAQTAVTRAQPETAVIQGKLTVPPLPERRVERPRLERSLAALIERNRVVVVSATAGAGKTTAVAAAVQLVERPVAWLTLDRTDAAPGRLVTYLEAAMSRPLPQLSGVARGALAAGIAHAEAAGLLAEAVGDAPVILVLDELERVGDSSEPWDVVEAFLRYATPETRFVLISRRAMPTALDAPTALEGSVAALGEDELAFTPAEAADALTALGEAEIDAAEVVDATGGWVTGVLFEAWRSAGHVAGVGGESDPLHGYLASHILGQLDPADRDFLVATSLLDQVSAARAEALGQTEAAQRLVALRAARLPVAWQPDGRAFRCHSRLREYLLERLERRGADEVRALRLAHGRLLAREGHDEEATEELLSAGAPGEALVSAERAILSVIERLDFPVAERWLDALAEVAPSGASVFTTAELMLAIGQHDLRRGGRIADQLAALGERERLARSGAAGVLMAWCYAALGRLDDAHELLAVAEPDPAVPAMRYAISSVEPGPPPDRPELSGGPFDAVIVAGDYFHGRLSHLADERSSRWIEGIAGASRIGALRVTGRTQRGLELYEAVRSRRVVPFGLDATVGPEVLIDAGRREEAREAIERGRRLGRASGSVAFELYPAVLEAKLALRLDRDPVAARAVLDPLEGERAAHPYPLVFEPLDTWYGLALLLQSEDAAALARLRRAVASMAVGDRILELPTAAVYLAEAEWRAGHDEAADHAADLAVDAARRLGSNHVLLQALADFPAVASRRIDAEAGADSPWHDLGRALLAQGVAVEARVRASVQLMEFGRSAIVVGGEEVRPRIAKTYELLAYLATRAARRAERDELLDALFDGRSDESTRAYLRQAVRWLRHVLPEADALVVERGAVRLSDDVLIASESTRFEAQLAEAARLQGADRLAATRDALAVYDRGAYLPGARSAWADNRRERLAQLAADARSEAAELAFGAARYDEAEKLADEVLNAEPFRETAWRLTMRIANVLGDDDRVIRAYHACERALAQVGTTPSPSTRQLLERLRR